MDKAFTTAAALLAATFVLAIGTDHDVRAEADEAIEAVVETAE